MEYKNLLKEVIKLKSISTKKDKIEECKKTAFWFKVLFENNGFDVNVIEGYDNPVVISNYKMSDEFETCLIYGHYDVQPAVKEEGWFNDPFEVLEKDGRLYARGVVDNKGQVLIHIWNVFEAIKNKTLKYNVKFILEGNEETGSPNLSKLLHKHKDLLKCDFTLISDGELTYDFPCIELGFRGSVNTTMEVTTSDRDLHSGLYGGTVPNAAKVLSDILSKLMGEDRSINIEGMYNSVKQPTKSKIDGNKEVPFSMGEFRRLTGCSQMLLEEGFEFYDQLAFRPCLEITGINTGYTGEGYRNSIPNYAIAKVNIRLTADQEPKEIADLIKKQIEKMKVSYALIKITCDQMNKGVMLDVDNNYVEKASKLLERAFGKKTLMKYCGASLPIVTDFIQILGVPQILAPLGNEDCAMHSVNENYRIDTLEKALEFSKLFFTTD